MSVLLVDIGNTRIKWALWRNGRIGRLHAEAHAGWSRRDYERRVFGDGGDGGDGGGGSGDGGGSGSGSGSETTARPSQRSRLTQPSRIIVACVAGARVEKLFAAAARTAASTRPEFIATSRRAAGVTTRYVEPWRLGVDRFVGVIGAYQRVGTRGACVVNIGTTVTIDLVDGQGMHRGGAILPGPQLMVRSLLEGTAGIERRAREAVPAARPDTARRGGRAQRAADLFARSTKEAIRQGVLYAVAAAVDRAVAEARARLGKTPVVLLTGGGAVEIERLIRARHVKVADLVLRGIAAYGGLEVR